MAARVAAAAAAAAAAALGVRALWRWLHRPRVATLPQLAAHGAYDYVIVGAGSAVGSSGRDQQEEAGKEREERWVNGRNTCGIREK